jgi:hypothetical protein
MITAAVNEFYKIANVTCGINQMPVSVPGFSIAGQLKYAVPSPILIPLTASFEGRMLKRISLGALARNYRTWASDTSIKMGVTQRWSQIGIDKFVIHPIDSIGGRDISITGVVEPTPLVNSNDTISLEDEYIQMAVDYAAHRVQLLEGGAIFEQASLLLNKFYEGINKRLMYQGYKFPNYAIFKGPFR